MPEGSTSSRTDRIKDPLLIPGHGSSAYPDSLSGDSPTASSDDTYIQVDDYAALQQPDGAVSSSYQPCSTVSAADGLEPLSSGHPQAEHHLSQEERSADTAHTSSGDHVIMDVLTTQEPVTANGTADGAIETADFRDSSASPQPTRESGHGEVPTDVDELIKDSAFLDLSSPMTAYEWFKVVFLFPWAFFKLIVVLLGLVIVWGWVRVLMIGVPINKPLPKWRFILVRPWLKFWTGLFMRAGLGLWPRFHGWKHYNQAKRERAIIVFNHCSYTDAIVMTSYFAPSGVAKASVASIPFIGKITIALQFLFVQRRGSADKNNKYTQAAGQTVEKLAERAADDRYPLVMIAPEGTTKHGNVLLRFSTGAFVPGRPVLPVLLKYHHKFFNVGWGITNTPWHIYRMLTQFANFLEVEALPVYHPSQEEKDSPALYTANVRKLMGERLGARLVDQGIGHNFALRKAGVSVNFAGTALTRR